jgi:hypothetical protein
LYFFDASAVSLTSAPIGFFSNTVRRCVVKADIEISHCGREYQPKESALRIKQAPLPQSVMSVFSSGGHDVHANIWALPCQTAGKL